MRFHAILASFVAILLLAPEAIAAKVQTQVTPKSQEIVGFAVVTEPREKEMVRVTVTRDLTKARTFEADSNLEIRRSSTLRVYGDDGMIVECSVDGEQKKETVIYRFTIARGRLANTHFTVAEIDDYKETENREHLLGGGTYFEFNLADFAAE